MARAIGRGEPCPGDRRRSAGRRSTSWPTSSTPPAPRDGRRAWRSSTRSIVQLRPGGRRGVRLPAGRPRLPGPDDRLRLLLRGDLGAAGRSARRSCRSPPGGSLLGVDLHAFLTERRVTAMCCVPTLLATLEDDLPALRFLLVSGEACPHDLDRALAPARPAVPQRLRPDRGDRQRDLGRRRPGPAGDDRRAAADLLGGDPRPRRPGPCAAARRGRRDRHRRDRAGAGYVNRDDLTAQAFVPDFLGVPGNASGRIYRTGDLGRVTADGEIEYLGRIDLQVKIRGYRIELTEIESVLLQVPGIAQAVVDTYEPVPGATELVGYYSLRTGAAPPGDDVLRGPPARPAAALHGARLPRAPSGHPDDDQRQGRPEGAAAPEGRGAPRTAEFVAPSGPTETVLAELLAATLGVERVSADRPLLRRPRRELAAPGAVRRAGARADRRCRRSRCGTCTCTPR